MPNPKIFPEMPSELRRFFPAIFWHWWEAFRVYLLTPSSDGGGGPTSASATVVSETSFGQAPSAGSSNTYSRGNHTHGTPAAISAGNTVVTETEFGQTSTAGTSGSYSRADHTHGTPALSAITTVIYTAASVTKFNGGTETGTITALQAMADGDEYNVVEQVADPGFNIEIGFTDIVAIPTHVVLRIDYEAVGSTHDVVVQLWNYNTSAYDNISQVIPSLDYLVANIPIPVFADYIDSGEAYIRIYHNGGGDVSHNIWIDYAALYSVGRGVAIFEGLDADKPSPTHSGNLYYATDTNKMYYDTLT